MAENWLKKYITAPLINQMGKGKLKARFSKQPIFIVGCGRSGTTLLLSILSAHPHIFALPHESTAFANWIEEEVDGTKRCVPQRLDRFYRYILLSGIPESALRFCEKTPNNVRVLDKILDFFEGQATIIHLIRDGRDVMLSRHPQNPDEYWVSPERWAYDVRYGLAYKDHPNVSTIFYEDLVRDYRSTIENICDFIGEPCTDEVYNWFDHSLVRQDRAWEGPVKEIHEQSLQKWKSTSDQNRVQEVIADDRVTSLLHELGYPEGA